MRTVERHWYHHSMSMWTLVLLPFSWIFYCIVKGRQFLYQARIKKTFRFQVPIVVIGNITVGGTGKTPLAIWLVNFLKEYGFRPGIVSRGFGGKVQRNPRIVNENADPKEVGDEAILLARRSQCPVVIGVNRVAAVQELLKNYHCNIVVSDDGLQHYSLGRDIEIAVIDGTRNFGNGKLLPAGPLRETLSRLERVDFVVTQGAVANDKYALHLQGDCLVSVKNNNETRMLEKFRYQKVHAVAAIGHPQRFFSMLREQGLDVIEHIFSDHYLYRKEDIFFPDGLPVIMTEKDAVKCQQFADERHWYLSVDAKVSAGFGEAVLAKLLDCHASHKARA